jgi:hypothetical protein
LVRSGFKKKRRRILGQFEIVGLVETWVETELGKNRKVVTKRIQMGMSKGKIRKEERKSCGGIIKGVKLEIKEKRQEKGEEEGYMERTVHIGNKWWKIMTIIYNRDEDNNKKCRRYNRRKQRRMYALGRGL